MLVTKSLFRKDSLKIKNTYRKRDSSVGILFCIKESMTIGMISYGQLK